MAADIRCYPAVFCRCFSGEKYVVSAAWPIGAGEIAENTKTHALAAALSRRFADGLRRFDRLMNTA
jgi:hypothetical protein